MGQEPNVELRPATAPRSDLEPPPPSRWLNDRPGAINRPEEQPWGGEFGRPGPDPGYALRLVRRADWDRSHRADEIEAVLATIVAARASLFGRAPVPQDVEVGLMLLGLRPHGLDGDLVGRLVERREHALDHAAHEIRKGSDMVAEISIDHLRAAPDTLPSLLR